MILSGIGIIAYNMWHEIKNHGNNVELGEFVVMPDHIHGILILNGIVENNENDCKNADTGYNGIAATNGICTTNGIVETTHALSLPHPLSVPNALSNPNSLSVPHPLSDPHPLSVPHPLSDPHPLPNAIALSIPSPQPAEKTIGQKRFQHQGKNTLSSIVGAYKSAVSKHAHRQGMEFGWQPRFHDHIIQDDTEYRRISRYILNNPSKWHRAKINKSI